MQFPHDFMHSLPYPTANPWPAAGSGMIPP